MQKNVFSCQIATQLGISQKFVEATLALLDEGCTIPFIARYRKERTGGLDEVQIAAISDRYEKLLDIQKRKETVIKTINYKISVKNREFFLIKKSNLIN